MKQPGKRKSWASMSAAELAAATTRFDRPTDFEQTRPLSPEQQAVERRARSVPARPAAKQLTIRVKVDAGLLERFDEFARRNNMTRDEFIARSLRSATAFVD